MDATKKKLFQFPWNFRESFIISFIILIVGFAAEFFFGGHKISLPVYPYNFIILLCLISAIVFLQLFIKHPVIRWLSSSPAAVAVIVVFTMLILSMGFVKQTDMPGHSGIIAKLGLSHVIHSFPYLFLTLFLLIILGFTIVRRLFVKSIKNIGFILSHAGLFIVLASASFGASDITTVYMNVKEGQTEWRVYDENGRMYEMPLAINLLNFIKEDFPPNLYLADPNSGMILKDNDNKKLPEVSEGMKCKMDKWNISVLTYFKNAQKKDSGYISCTDTVFTPAAYVEATEIASGKSVKGWISVESNMKNPETMLLDENHLLYMAVPKAKKFSSLVKIYTKDKQSYDAYIAVNSPFSVNGWKIYQHSYELGFKDGEHTSIFQLINDPWLGGVYTGIFMMLGGGLFLFWFGKSKSEKRKEEIL